MKSTGKKRLKSVGVVWVGWLAVVLVAFLLVVMPQERAKVQIARQLTDKRQAIIHARETASVQTRTQLDQEIESLQSMVGDFVMDHTTAANLAFEVSRISKDMKLDAFTLTNTDKDGFVKVSSGSDILARPVNLSFNTSFNRFAAFLNALERYRPAIFADTFRIVRVPGEAGMHQVNMKLYVLVSNYSNDADRTTSSAKLAVRQ
ncbi:MAG: hypothetical protein JXN61_00280 [Sedimentisphaerales bacterium]|nr:hypothetical protein [Sedimentisphaerales bacterium]